MKEELMRRISAALDSPDGLAGDPALQDELRASKDAAKYAKDLTRVGKWLAVWPLPEPDDAAFEALASRIEQRLDESLPTMSDPTALPTFDDDDALRDAAASLLQSGEYPLSDASIQIISDPSIALVSDPAIPIPAMPESMAAAAPPPAPAPAALARVALGKARPAAIVEEHAADGSGEPLSAAELELRLGAKGQGEKKKKKKAGARSSLPPGESSDRISIPTPKPTLGAPSLSPVVQLPKAEERKPAATLWWFAAAAAVGLGVFGAATLFESESAPVAETAHGSTLVTSGAIAPTTPHVAAPSAAAPADLAAADTVPEPVAAIAPMPPATAAPLEERAHARPSAPPATMVASADPMARGTPAPRPMRTASGSSPSGDYALDDALGGATRHRAAGSGASPAPTTATAAPTPPTPTGPASGHTTRESPAPPPPPTTTPSATPEETGPLPETPDRATIQAVLAARSDAVSACAAGAHGLADVDIVIASSGRITTATVNGSFAGTPVGSCIARAVRGARFPPFSQPRFEVTYPFHL